MRIIGLLDRYEAIVGELFQVDLVLLIGSLTGDLTNAGIAEDTICVLSLIQSYTTNSLAVLGKKHISANTS